MFDYETLYRAESVSNVYPILQGAVRTGERTPISESKKADRWVFWVGPQYDHPVFAPFDLFDLRKEGDMIVAMRSGSNPVEYRFYPLRMDWVYAHPERYSGLLGVDPAEVKDAFPLGLDSVESRLGKSIYYDLQWEKTAMADQAAREISTSPVEESKKPVTLTDDKYPIGALRLVNGRFYEKIEEGVWVPTAWFP